MLVGRDESKESDGAPTTLTGRNARGLDGLRPLGGNGEFHRNRRTRMQEPVTADSHEPGRQHVLQEPA